MPVVDIMVGNYIDINWEVFSLWLEGNGSSEAAFALRDTTSQHTLLTSDLNDHYRMFTMLEPLLHQPKMFAEQLVWQLDAETQKQLISRYYAMDNTVARELLGRKLSSRLKKDLDEISEKTGVSLKSCRRQFENIKRVFKELEDMPGNFYNNIRSEFCLPAQLAERYSVLVFVASHRFETCKKKLNPVHFEDFATVSRSMMENWSCQGIDVDEEGEATFDRDFVNSLRDLKILVDRDKELRQSVLSRIPTGAIAHRTLVELEANFKSFNRNIIGIAQTLYHNKEIRDIFVHVVDKLVDMFRQIRLTLQESEVLFVAYHSAVLEGGLPLDHETRANFERFLKTLTLITTTFYTAIRAS